MTTPTYLFVPGLRDHVEEHWQTLLAKKLPNSCIVPPLEHNKLSRDARINALDKAVSDISGPIVLVAHSAGCMIVVQWLKQLANKSSTASIKAALLAAPADVESPMPAGYPTVDALRDNGWLPVPRTALPFPSIVAASTNDPLCSSEQAASFARDWGSRLVDVGAVGHINPAAGFGIWPQAESLLAELV